jgi:hypothetical protein
LIELLAFGLFAPVLFAKDGLQIDRAFCGAADSWCDVTPFFRGEVRGDSLSTDLTQPFDEIGGDPAPHSVKMLVVDYHFRGRPYRLLLDEQVPIAFRVRLPSVRAAAPGIDERASEIMAIASARPIVRPLLLWRYWSPAINSLALLMSFIALICGTVALVQLRRIKKERHIPTPREQ